MHLSLLSDACLSDLLDDSAAPATPSAQHLDGLLRGLCGRGGASAADRPFLRGLRLRGCHQDALGGAPMTAPAIVTSGLPSSWLEVRARFALGMMWRAIRGIAASGRAGSRNAVPPVVPVAAMADLRAFEVDTGGSAARVAATVLDAPATLAVELAARQETPIVPPRAFVVELERTTIIDGVVETRRGVILAESLINRDPGDLPGRPRRSARVHRLSGRPHVLLKQRWDSNYGHWLVEALPRLALVQERFDLSELGFIVSGWHGAAMTRVYEDSLALFGIRRDQIVEIGLSPVAVDRLVYPTPMTEHPWHMAPRCVAVLEALAERVQAAPVRCKRLYVSRNGAGRRRLVNEEEILPIVRARGFTVVAPETLSLYAQIGLFRGATHVVGAYGAALTNVAFTHARPSLLALTSPWMQDDFFSTLMSLKRGSYTSLHGTPCGAREEGENGAKPARDAHFHIDPARFATLLDAWL